MAVDYGVKLGFAPCALIKALLLVQFIGFPAAVAYGWLADRVGTRRMIYVGLLIYGAVTVGSYWLKSESDFYLLAAAIGLVKGRVQSLSRSYYARLVPSEQSAQFFGLYKLLGKFTTWLGAVW